MARRALVAALVAALAWTATSLGALRSASRVGDGRGGVARHHVGNFDSPIYVTRAPGVDRILYVVKRPGTVKAVAGGERHTFLDIQDRTTTEGEGGLLSIAFDPGYQSNGLLYAYYTNSAGDIEIDEFATNSDTNADEASRRQVIVVPHSSNYHYGGTLAFGPGGYLYAATGDGATGGTPSQSTGSLLGKVLRIDPHQSGADPYTVPAGNPFVGQSGADAIYAMGLRNPFRFSFDRRRILIGDVGQNSWEEVDYETNRNLNGANFGWPLFEGDHRYSSGPKPAHYEPPIFEYPHPNSGLANITGGLVVHDRGLPSLVGRYVYSDFQNGRLHSFVPRLRRAPDDKPLGLQVDHPVDFARGPDGHIYVASLDGPLYKLVHR